MTITDKQIEATRRAWLAGGDTYIGSMIAVLEAADAAAWEPIETAPTDGTLVIVYAAPRDGLRGFVTCVAYHEDAGWCVDDIRYATHWRQLPTPPKGE